ncbi:hypothetical protein EK904_010018 [Melospiza melodia maxima]|nr:hypothetical protein EK904_010018 [Melospiza melodia maxima]
MKEHSSLFCLRGNCFGDELYGVTQEGVIQAVFFGICVLTDLSSLLTRGNDSQEQERQLKKLISLRDWMMAVLAFPVGVVRIPLLPSWKKKILFPIVLVSVTVLSLGFVVTMFWSIYIYDRELVYPKLLDNFIPAWLNHGMVLEIGESMRASSVNTKSRSYNRRKREGDRASERAQKGRSVLLNNLRENM